MGTQSVELQQFVNAPGQQRGAISLGLIAFLGMAAVVLTLAFKVSPLVYEQWQVENVLYSFENERELSDLSAKDIESRFKARLITNNVRDFNYDESVFISMEDDTLVIEVEYESRENVFKNIDAVVVFQDRIEVRY